MCLVAGPASFSCVPHVGVFPARPRAVSHGLQEEAPLCLSPVLACVIRPCLSCGCPWAWSWYRHLEADRASTAQTPSAERAQTLASRLYPSPAVMKRLDQAAERREPVLSWLWRPESKVSSGAGRAGAFWEEPAPGLAPGGRWQWGAFLGW